MSSSQRSVLSRGSSRKRRSVGVVVVGILALGGLLSACAAPVPQAVLNVPGSYTANLWAPTPSYPSGQHPSETIVMCLDEVSAVQLDGPPLIRLTWNGTVHEGYGNLVTPVLQPGCGTLQFGIAGPGYIPNYMTITATKV